VAGRKDQCRRRRATRGGRLTEVEGMRKAAAMAEQDKGEPILYRIIQLPLSHAAPVTHFAWSVRAGPFQSCLYALHILLSYRSTDNRDSGSCVIISTTRFIYFSVQRYIEAPITSAVLAVVFFPI